MGRDDVGFLERDDALGPAGGLGKLDRLGLPGSLGEPAVKDPVGLGFEADDTAFLVPAVDLVPAAGRVFCVEGAGRAFCVVGAGRAFCEDGAGRAFFADGAGSAFLLVPVDGFTAVFFTALGLLEAAVAPTTLSPYVLM